MEEILKHIADYGLAFVLAAIFIWRSLKSDKANAEILRELQANVKLQTDTLNVLRQESSNTHTSLSIIQNTIAGNTQAQERHDQRAEHMNTDIRATLELTREVIGTLKSRPCVTTDDAHKK
jgi:hypothetical protein